MKSKMNIGTVKKHVTLKSINTCIYLLEYQSLCQTAITNEVNEIHKTIQFFGMWE